jgi:hypothetical protein
MATADRGNLRLSALKARTPTGTRAVALVAQRIRRTRAAEAAGCKWIALCCVILGTLGGRAEADQLRTPPLWSNGSAPVSCTAVNANANRGPLTVQVIGVVTSERKQCPNVAQWGSCSLTITNVPPGPVVCVLTAQGLPDDLVEATLSVGRITVTLRAEG